MTTVAIPFVIVPPRENPNLRAGIADPVRAYMRAAIVTLASFRRFEPAARLQFISTAHPAPEYAQQLQALDVEVVIVPFRHRPPVGFATRFSASFYLLDAVATVTDDETVFVDPDVLAIRSIQGMLANVNGRLAAIDLHLRTDEDITGLTRRGAGELHGVLGEPAAAPKHYGGEILVVPPALAAPLLQRCNDAWALSLLRFDQGKSRFTTEEHVLSFAVRALPFTVLNGFARRIWTTHSYRTASAVDAELTLWHLPAEKSRGFASLYPFVVDKSSWFWSSDRKEYVRRVSRVMSVHRRSPVRVIVDVVALASKRAQNLLKKPSE